MPQMAPMNWFALFATFNLLLILTNVKLHFLLKPVVYSKEVSSAYMNSFFVIL